MHTRSNAGFTRMLIFLFAIGSGVCAGAEEPGRGLTREFEIRYLR